MFIQHFTIFKAIVSQQPFELGLNYPVLQIIIIIFTLAATICYMTTMPGPGQELYMYYVTRSSPETCKVTTLIPILQMMKLKFNNFYWLPLFTQLVSDVLQTWTQICFQDMAFSPFIIELQIQSSSEKITLGIRKKRKFFSQCAKERVTINTLSSTLNTEDILLDLSQQLPFNKAGAYQEFHKQVAFGEGIITPYQITYG